MQALRHQLALLLPGLIFTILRRHQLLAAQERQLHQVAAPLEVAEQVELEAAVQVLAALVGFTH